MELGENRREPMKKTFWILALALGVSTANAEITVLTDTDEVARSEKTVKTFVGFEANNILLLEDGSIAFSIHGGVSFHPLFRLGLYASTVANDVNLQKGGKKISVDYKSLGIFTELKPFAYNAFSISVPLTAGAGFTNISKQGSENSKADDGFFMGDAALHFNYKITRSLEIGIGGGYRFFLGISEDGFSNGDFNTPFGAVFINWSEF